MKWIESKVVGCFVGLACGDAVGTTLEFKPKGSFTPITDMVGGGPFNLEKGQWTDDTSMALCLAASLLQKQAFDAKDQMNRYCNWWQNGYLSSTGECFDIGITITKALTLYLETGNPFCGSSDPLTSGNGALMRLAPIAIFYLLNPNDGILFAGESTRTTHGSQECIDSSRYFYTLLARAVFARDKTDIFSSQFKANTSKVKQLVEQRYLTKDYDSLTGSGYVIESLESALWCFYHGNSFEESILMAANIGNDADTTAAICGQLAGAFYGIEGIPKHWVSYLAESELITSNALDLYHQGNLSVGDSRVCAGQPMDKQRLDELGY